MAVNANTLINFGTSSNIGDVGYSAYTLTAPSYLPLNNETSSYLVSSYPALAALVTTPATAYSSGTTSLSSSTQWFEIAYGNGMWIAINPNPFIAVSTNGVNWSLKEPFVGATGRLASPTGISFANGVFIITTNYSNTSAGTQVHVSSDGINWSRTDVAPASLYTLKPIYCAGEWFLMNSTSSTAWYRSGDNGTTWFAYSPNSGAATGWTARATNGIGTTIFGGHITSTSAISSSINAGASWIAQTTPNGTFGALAYGNGMFVALDTPGTASTVAASSPDGVTWTARTLPTSSIWRSVTYGNGIFLALSNTGTNAATSTDGMTWTTRTLASANNWVGCASGGPSNNKYFIGVANTLTFVTVSYAVAATTFTLPVLPTIKGTIPYIKAT